MINRSYKQITSWTASDKHFALWHSKLLTLWTPKRHNSKFLWLCLEFSKCTIELKSKLNKTKIQIWKAYWKSVSGDVEPWTPRLSPAQKILKWNQIRIVRIMLTTNQKYYLVYRLEFELECCNKFIHILLELL